MNQYAKIVFWVLIVCLGLASCSLSPKRSMIAEQLVVVTTARVLNDGDYEKLKNGDTIEDNPITRWARNRLGIVQANKWIVADEAALEHKVKLAIGGEEELPDVLFLNDKILPALLSELATSGRIMDIEEAFERYATPRMKQAYALNPDVWKTVQADGKLWGLPQISDGKVGDPILWIRQDWLDRLDLQAPTTIKELEAVMDAFVNRDPDGNGIRDTYGLALAGKDSINSWTANASFLFGAYGNQPNQWNRMPDGSLAYGSVQPEIVRSLTILKDWHARNFLHPDFGSHDELTAMDLFANGQAGVISGPGWMGGWPLSEVLKDGKKSSVFKPIPFPAGEDGRVGRKGSKISYGSYLFRKDFPHLDKVFQYWDQVYGALIEDPNSDFIHGFAENYDYRVQDGKVEYEFPGMTTTISQQLLIAPGSVPPGVMKESLEERVYRGQIETPYEQKLAATSSRLFLEGIIVGDQQLEFAQRDQFLGARSRTMQMKWPALQRLEKEAFLKVVYGKAPPESFGDFVRDWQAYGGKEVTQEVNEWDKAQQTFTEVRK